mgnify:CR=1 FL=1
MNCKGKTFVRLSSFETTYLRNSYFPYFADLTEMVRLISYIKMYNPEIMMMFIFCFLLVKIL